MHSSAPTRGNLRWVLAALIGLVTCINIVDRTSISLLRPVFGPAIGVSTMQYARVGAILLAAYTLSQTISGRLYDRFGARIGYTVSISLWCAAACAHSLITGFYSFAACSFVLGLGEAGNWPGAAKVIAEQFPQSERAIGMAIFNAGSSAGGVLGPIVVIAVQQWLGWRVAFAVIGALGILWLPAWLHFYRTPKPAHENPQFLHAQPTHSPQNTAPFSTLFRNRATWAILAARFFVDPVWWLYLLWLPSYLVEARHINVRQLAVFAWFPYLAAAIGALFGGWLAKRLIHKGLSVNAARRLCIALAAILMPFGILAARAGCVTLTILWISLVLFGFQMWIANVQTLPSDLFPADSVATVAGLGGTAAGVSSLLFNLFTGFLVVHFGYASVLTIAGILSPIGLIFLFVLMPTIPTATLTLKRS